MFFDSSCFALAGFSPNPPSNNSGLAYHTMVLLSDVLTVGLWLGCQGDLLAAKESTTSYLANFIAPTQQLTSEVF